MKNALIIAILALIIGLSAYYVYRAKKRGRKCIGCPDSCSCSKKCCDQ
ncbi:MAG: FeoB-associated Cys-rich membrane protein [Ruminococcaceae bacterium]|nr:FeoB-associated Cys-rich membrane protein [Oscillospiraceae bacterium]